MTDPSDCGRGYDTVVSEGVRFIADGVADNMAIAQGSWKISSLTPGRGQRPWKKFTVDRRCGNGCSAQVAQVQSCDS